MIVWDTITHRWYAFAFLIVFLWAARAERSWRGVLRFLAIAFGVSLLAELSSTRNGFPYGRYAYTARVDEIHISNVPLFVPLTFGVVVWAGRALARRRGASGLLPLVAGSAFAATAIDLVIDPVTVRGSEWFLGPLYRYAHPGGWFGVPWSNFGGWLLVSAAIVLIDALLERQTGSSSERGVRLAAAICIFFVVMGFVIGRPDIGFAGLGITAALLWLSRYA